MEEEKLARPVERIFGAEIGFSVHAEKEGKAMTSTSLDEMTELPYNAKIADIWRCWQEDLLRDQGILESNTQGFMSNGARFYFDQQRTPEYCTPEVSSPEQLVIYELSAERFVINVLNRMKEVELIDQFYANKRTTDQIGNSWGYHENILAYAPMDDTELAGAFNSTRAVYTGAGGILETTLNPSYVVSPRLAVTKQLSNAYRTDNEKPLVCTDNSNKERNMYRIHQVSSDASLSPWTIRMQHATNSLLMKAIESDRDYSSFYLNDAIRSSAIIAGDLSLKSTVELESGKNITAVEWQSAFAEKLKVDFSSSELSDDELWALAQIEQVTEDLNSSPDLASDRVEWVSRLHSIRDLSSRDPQTEPITDIMKAIDYTWDSLDKRGIAIKKRQNGWGWTGFESQPEDWEVNQALRHPPSNTRAYIRADVIRAGEGDLVEDWGTLSGGKRIHPLASKSNPKPTRKKIIKHLTEKFNN